MLTGNAKVGQLNTAMPCDAAQSLAVDISLAALLGDKVYSFGELLLHPIVSSLSRPLLVSFLVHGGTLTAVTPMTHLPAFSDVDGF